jgi:hypothetical protein
MDNNEEKEWHCPCSDMVHWCLILVYPQQVASKIAHKKNVSHYLNVPFSASTTALS